MLCTANAMLICCPGTSPQVYEFNPRPGRSLVEPFERRVAELAAGFGEPRRETRLDWYPHLEEAACWDRGEKTVVLAREPEGRCGARIVLWCATDAERATLAEAGRTRSVRVANLEREFGNRIAASAEPGWNAVIRRKVLVDDLAAVPEVADALLTAALRDPDGEVRCLAVELALALGGVRALPRVVPLLDDPEEWVRYHAIGCTGHYGDGSVVDALIGKLRSDPEPGVRGQAAYALGHVGSPRAIPALLHALDHDTEPDPLGHTPSSVSATALDNILGTHETRIKLDDGLCSLAPWPPDHDRLRRLATELYETWKADGAG